MNLMQGLFQTKVKDIFLRRKECKRLFENETRFIVVARMLLKEGIMHVQCSNIL